MRLRSFPVVSWRERNHLHIWQIRMIQPDRLRPAGNGLLSAAVPAQVTNG
jgi:hypothetical protein